MPDAVSIARVPPGKSTILAARITFFIAGCGVSAWAPLVPFAKDRIGLNAAELGVLLLCLGAGSTLLMPLSGVLASRYGCRRVLVCATLLLCATLPLLAVLANPILFAICLFLFGAAVGTVDCTGNIQAVIVERASGRTMMSGLHGLYSVGGIAGAAGVTALLSAGASPLLATIIVTAVILLALLTVQAGMLDHGSDSGGPAFAVPHGIVLFIGILCFIVFLTEGAMLDWSAVFLSDVRGVSSAYAGLGYAAFAATMTLGRLTGDIVVRRLGPRRIIVGGSLLAAFGLVLATLIPQWEFAVLGYALVGAGCSNIVPVMYSLTGRQTTMPENIAIPAITTLGYCGMLLGPAFIGFLAHVSNLPIAILMVAVLLVGVAASARALKTS